VPGDADYVRAVERHVCQKNDGHLIRVVGPAFEVVTRWERDGIPLKVALQGIDRYFERYYRNGPKRRPVRVEFCDNDVMDAFDEWRRAVGVTRSTGAPEQDKPDRRGPSLPTHLERVLLKLSSARATGRLDASVDTLIDRVSVELDHVREHARGLRGEARRAVIGRLAVIDRELLDAVWSSLGPADRETVTMDADEELSPFRARMAPEAYARARGAIVDRLLRERTGLPELHGAP
jgi:hypothetical protein